LHFKFDLSRYTAGTYQPYSGTAGPASCLPCQAGKCSDAVGSTDCYQCCPVSNLVRLSDKLNSVDPYSA
jgi:hypothetical protein